MAGLTNSVEAEILDYLLDDVTPSWDALTNLYVVLYTTTPTADDGTGGTEVADANAYARTAIARNGTGWNSATLADPSVADNAAAITFPTASGGNWGTINGFGIATSGTHGGGTLLAFADLDTPKAVNDGDTAEFAAGALDVKLGDPGDSY